MEHKEYAGYISVDERYVKEVNKLKSKNRDIEGIEIIEVETEQTLWEKIKEYLPTLAIFTAVIGIIIGAFAGIRIFAILFAGIVAVTFLLIFLFPPESDDELSDDLLLIFDDNDND